MTDHGRFCWLDLAATDAERAAAFYSGLLGWRTEDRAVARGAFTRLRLGGEDVGSMYQLSARHIALGAPSHWTPYVQVADVAQAARRAEALGGEVMIPPVRIDGVARISLILDAVGAQVGLWEPAASRLDAAGPVGRC